MYMMLNNQSCSGLGNHWISTHVLKKTGGPRSQAVQAADKTTYGIMLQTEISRKIVSDRDNLPALKKGLHARYGDCTNNDAHEEVPLFVRMYNWTM